MSYVGHISKYTMNYTMARCCVMRPAFYFNNLKGTIIFKITVKLKINMFKNNCIKVKLLTTKQSYVYVRGRNWTIKYISVTEVIDVETLHNKIQKLYLA